MLMIDPEAAVSIATDQQRERIAAARQPVAASRNIRRATGRALVRAGTWLSGPNRPDSTI
jgi:hypothetical protein